MDRIAPTIRPDRKPQGSQRWDRLLFVHWEVPEGELRPLVDGRLTIDAFDGKCYVGLVAFTMQHVRPYRWAPPIPTARQFGEINLRTYVHLNGREPGVWFFSLDAESALAVAAARMRWHLPYYKTDMSREDDGVRVRWAGRRQFPRPAPVDFVAEYEVGEPVDRPGPESLEYFLVERYQFYAAHRDRLYRARVHHRPYELHRALVGEPSVPLLQAAGFGTDGPRAPDWFSPGVDVEVFALERIDRSSAGDGNVIAMRPGPDRTNP